MDRHLRIYPRHIPLLPKDPDEHRLVFFPQCCTYLEDFSRILLIKGYALDLLIRSPPLRAFLRNLNGAHIPVPRLFRLLG
ncbi:hypothetical protein LIER_06290 [Lithospermum erythrorhizon]|uniref:Maturase K n=1 Tax=Lithospermum erythrorhizon TaxID=34254 RepID=A0AAV3P496_LITER